MSHLVAKLVATGGPLGREVANAHHSWQQREALLYRITGRDGRIGMGEAAPLPGYSSDTLSECKQALSSLRLADTPRTLASVRSSLLGIAPEYPAARFAAETALLDLLAQDRQTSIAELLGAQRGVARRCSLLDSQDVLGSARALLARGIRSAKLKVGRSWPEEIEIIRQLRSQLPALGLRLDANAAWSIDESWQHLRQLSDLDIEFVEQPVAPELMAELVGSPVPLAADESMARASWRDALLPLADEGTLVAVVLKPTILGGLLACIELAEWAATRGLASVASHTFEGLVGTAAVAELAVATRGRFAAGLDLHPGLPPAILPAQLAGTTIESHRPGLGVPPGP